jgi:hypothetical protein
VQPDYAKLMLEDPRVNFAISQRGRQRGGNHLGFQTEADQRQKFDHVALMLQRRIELFLSLPLSTLDRMTIQAMLKDIRQR